MFLIWILFTGTCIHTLKGKETQHHIITNNASWVKCAIFHIVSSLFYMRGRCIHTLKDKKSEYHILTWWVKCTRVPTGIHIHTLRERTTPPHIVTDRFMVLTYPHFQIFLDWVSFTGICSHTFMDRRIHHHILIDKCLMGELLERCHSLFI